MNKSSRPTTKEYRLFIANIKSRIRVAQVKASFSVNAELIRLYWDIGQAVVDRQNKDGWGSAVVQQISRDIQKEFPGIEGFSSSNISRMRTFYRAWRGLKANSAQAVPNLKGKGSAQSPTGIMDILFHIPWGHHVYGMRTINPLSGLFYVRRVIK